MRIIRTFATFALSIGLVMAEDATVKAKALMKEKKFEEAIKLLETAYAKSKTGEVKQALADAHVANGNAFMYNDALPPFQKYPNALRQFRKALEYDKENAKAKANIATIEGIYKSMGRPVPQ
jgi:tetratricopeptide (TPR) repeat protein